MAYITSDILYTVFYIIFAVLMKYIQPTFHSRSQPSYKISSKYINPRLNYNKFLKFKMEAGTYLGFPKTWFLSTGSPWAADFPPRYQIWWKMLIDAEIMAQNRNPRWRPSAILDFQKSDFRSAETPWAADFPSLCQIWHKYADRRRNYGQNVKIQDGGRPPSWICYITI